MKRRQAGARKAAATKKQKSTRQKSGDKEATAGNSISNTWNLWMYQVESGFALNVLFNIFKANTVQKCSVAM